LLVAYRYYDIHHVCARISAGQDGAHGVERTESVAAAQRSLGIGAGGHTFAPGIVTDERTCGGRGTVFAVASGGQQPSFHAEFVERFGGGKCELLAASAEPVIGGESHGGFAAPDEA